MWWGGGGELNNFKNIIFTYLFGTLVRHEWQNYERISIPFTSKRFSQKYRDTHFFNEIEVRYRFYYYL